MEQKGIVVRIDGGNAKIRIDRQSMCGGNCASCKGCPSEVVLITVENNLGLSIGDEVILTSDTKGVLLAAFVGYVGLSVCLIGGAVLGYIWGGTEVMATLGAVLGIGAGFLALKLIYSKKEPKYEVRKAE